MSKPLREIPKFSGRNQDFTPWFLELQQYAITHDPTSKKFFEDSKKSLSQVNNLKYITDHKDPLHQADLILFSHIQRAIPEETRLLTNTSLYDINNSGTKLLHALHSIHGNVSTISHYTRIWNEMQWDGTSDPIGYCAEIITAKEQVANHVDNYELIRRLFNGLPSDYLSVIGWIKPDDSVQDAVRQIRRHYDSKPINPTIPINNVNTKHKKPPKPIKPCNGCGARHFRSECPHKNTKCNKCGKLGHIRRVCRSTSQREQRDNRDNTQHINLFESTQWVINTPCNAINTTTTFRAMLDSGASQHLFCSTNHLSNIRKINRTLTAANGTALQVTHIGDLHTFAKDINGKKTQFKIENINVSQDVNQNLISTHTLFKENESKTHLDDNAYLLHHNVKYAIDMNGQQPFINFYSGDPSINTVGDTLQTWHNRLSHGSRQAIKTLSTAVDDMHISDNNQDFTCEPCEATKLGTKQPFKHTESKDTTPNHRIHIDFMGPLNPPGPNGENYIFHIVDQSSQFIFCRIGKNTRSQVKDLLQDYFRTFGKPNVIRMDNAPEFTSKQFSKFLLDNGIKAEYTAFHTPQQNSSVETSFSYIKQDALAILKWSRLPKQYWTYAWMHAIYVRNRMVARGRSKTRFEIFTGTKPSLAHLKTFGCAAFVHVPKATRTKLDENAVKGIHLGISHQRSAYIILIPKVGIKYSRSVRFLEDQPGGKLLQNAKHNQSHDDIIDEDSSVTLQSRVPQQQQQQVQPQPVQQAQQQPSPPMQLAQQQQQHSQPPIQTRYRQNLDVVEKAKQDKETRVLRSGNKIPTPSNTQQINMIITGPEPTQYNLASMDEATKSLWKPSMEEEINGLMARNNTTFIHRDQLTNDQIQGHTIWRFKQKVNPDGTTRLKARLCARGDLMDKPIHDTYSPTSAMTTNLIVIAIAAAKNQDLHLLDAKQAFLNCSLEEPIYYDIPQFIRLEGGNPVVDINSKPSKEFIMKSNDNFYGLHDAARIWYNKHNECMLAAGLQQSQVDPAMHFNSDCISTSHVDDCLTTTSSPDTINTIIRSFANNGITMNATKKPETFCGIQIDHQPTGLLLHVEKKIHELLERTGLQSTRPITAPYQDPSMKLTVLPMNEQPIDETLFQSIIGSLNWITAIRPDIVYAVTELSRYAKKPGPQHWDFLKYLLRYLKGTATFGIKFNSGSELTLQAYCDATWGNCKDTGRSTSGILVLLGNTPIYARSKRQSTTALSSSDSEIIAMCETARIIVSLRLTLQELGLQDDEPTSIICDSQSAVQLVNRPGSNYSRSRHMIVKIAYLRELSSSHIIDVIHRPRSEQLADILCKYPPRQEYINMRDFLMNSNYRA